jgi:Ribbon-helix-helix protein, copG family
MSRQNKVHVPTETAIALRQAAMKRGTSISHVVQRLVADHLEAPTTDDCLVEEKRGRVSAAYLSNALSDAVHALAQQNGESQSWVIRDLIRSELRRRGLLPSPTSAPVATFTS